MATASPSTGDNSALAQWAARLSEQDMPAFADTVRKTADVAAGTRSSAAELARVVLEDAALTAQVLKLANSPLYNVGRRISTVSRAVVLLGFDAVRNTCLSHTLVDSLVSGGHRARVAQHMARSFHAAVQARAFAQKRRDGDPEEVFIAALLYRLGAMAVWCFGGERADEAVAHIERTGCSEDEAVQQVFGFRPDELTNVLCHQWQLSPLLEATLDPKAEREPRTANVTRAHQVARAVEEGWSTSEVADLTRHLAETLYMKPDEVDRLMRDNAAAAAQVTRDYGAREASELIPVPEQAAASEPDEPQEPPPPFPEPDPGLQLQILREITGMLEGELDFNLLLEMIAEGLHRGVGLDRVAFALLSRNRRQLIAKYVMGAGFERLREAIRFELGGPNEDLVAHMLLEHPQPVWVPDRLEPARQGLVSPALRAVGEGAPFFLAPVVVKGKPIGVFYADCAPSARTLDEERYASFKHFCQQAHFGLTQIDERRR